MFLKLMTQTKFFLQCLDKTKGKKMQTKINKVGEHLNNRLISSAYIAQRAPNFEPKVCVLLLAHFFVSMMRV